MDDIENRRCLRFPWLRDVVLVDKDTLEIRQIILIDRDMSE